MKALVSCLSVLLLVSGNTPQVQAPQQLTHATSQCLGSLPSLQFPDRKTSLLLSTSSNNRILPWKSSQLISKIHGCPLRTSV